MTVFSEDNKRLGTCHAAELGDSRLEVEVERPGSSDRRMAVRAPWVLGPRALEFLQTCRHRNRRGDVVLKCMVETVALVSRAYNATFTLGQQVRDSKEGRGQANVVVYETPGMIQFSTPITNMWVVSGASGPAFLARDVSRQEVPIAIPSAEWLHDFEAAFLSTQYLVVELPSPRVFGEASETVLRVQAAVEAARKAQDRCAMGEWGDVIEDLRPVWELLRDDTHLRALLLADGYSEEAIKALNDSVQGQYKLASKFLHRTEQKTAALAPRIEASREDAVMCYSFAMGVLNLITRKLARQARK